MPGHGTEIELMVRLSLLTRNFLCASAPLRLIRPYNPRMTINEITEATIGAAIEVHRAPGPGLLESAL